MQKTLSLGYAKAETEDFAAKNGGYTPGGYKPEGVIHQAWQ